MSCSLKSNFLQCSGGLSLENINTNVNIIVITNDRKDDTNVISQTHTLFFFFLIWVLLPVQADLVLLISTRARIMSVSHHVQSLLMRKDPSSCSGIGCGVRTRTWQTGGKGQGGKGRCQTLVLLSFVYIIFFFSTECIFFLLEIVHTPGLRR